MSPLPPLPLPQRRQVDAPGIEAVLHQNVDGYAVAAAGIEHARSRLQLRRVKPLDAPARTAHLRLEAALMLLGQRLTGNVGVVILPAGEVGNAVGALVGRAAVR